MYTFALWNLNACMKGCMNIANLATLYGRDVMKYFKGTQNLQTLYSISCISVPNTFLTSDSEPLIYANK